MPSVPKAHPRAGRATVLLSCGLTRAVVSHIYDRVIGGRGIYWARVADSVR